MRKRLLSRSDFCPFPAHSFARPRRGGSVIPPCVQSSGEANHRECCHFYMRHKQFLPSRCSRANGGHRQSERDTQDVTAALTGCDKCQDNFLQLGATKNLLSPWLVLTPPCDPLASPVGVTCTQPFSASAQKQIPSPVFLLPL